MKTTYCRNKNETCASSQLHAPAGALGEIYSIAMLLIIFSVFPQPSQANSGVRYRDIAAVEDSGLDYSRVPSASALKWEGYREAGIFTFIDGFDAPLKWRGSPGVALLDYDGDGDLDIYVTNGPGADNSLFSNQLRETRELFFVDVGAAAGVGAYDQDSSGVCFGDTDNDGDQDLLVLSNFGHNRLFENNGNGTFTDLSPNNALSVDTRSSVSCSFGDFDGDGLLDVVVANTWADMSNQFGIALDPFAFNQHNQLFINTGGNSFVDVSATSGIEHLKGFPPGLDGSASVTWAVAAVDYDLDGDVDIIHADDQGAIPQAARGGVDRGFVHVLQNDGTGFFTDVTVESNMARFGAWMGLAFGDLNADGFMDIFSTNFGDWGLTPFSSKDPYYTDLIAYELGEQASRWFLGGPGGIFTDPGVGALVATPFGWGTSVVDYDNDGDSDIIYHGGMSSGPIVQGDNPGLILNNGGDADFTYDLEALENSTNHARRTVHGMAVGDLNDDGFADIVSVSNSDIQDSIPMRPYGVTWDSPLDGLLSFQATFIPSDTPFTWIVNDHEDNVNGSVSVEISSAGTQNRWVKLRLLGTAGLLDAGMVNRDGIGAVVKMTTQHDKSTMRPVLGGSSYASQDSLELTFGLEKARKGQVDVLWPGGVRNRLYGVHAGEVILFPEIPCSYDVDWPTFLEYQTCVRDALGNLLNGGFIDSRSKGRLQSSAIRAYHDARH